MASLDEAGTLSVYAGLKNFPCEEYHALAAFGVFRLSPARSWEGLVALTRKPRLIHLRKMKSFLSVAALAATASALGINCRGSGLCPSDGAPGNLINLKAIVDNIAQRDRHYDTGQQIACTGSLCAFYQNGASGTADQTSTFLGQLLDHGCHKCGSVPTQGGNDVSKGELTVNVVGDPHCQGAC